jgi:hypothetical protein
VQAFRWGVFQPPRHEVTKALRRMLTLEVTSLSVFLVSLWLRGRKLKDDLNGFVIAR